MPIVYASLDAQLVLELDVEVCKHECLFLLQREGETMFLEVQFGDTACTFMFDNSEPQMCMLKQPGKGGAAICTVTLRGHSPLRLVLNNVEAVCGYMKTAAMR